MTFLIIVGVFAVIALFTTWWTRAIIATLTGLVIPFWIWFAIVFTVSIVTFLREDWGIYD